MAGSIDRRGEPSVGAAALRVPGIDDEFEERLEAFELAWQQRQRPAIETYLPAVGEAGFDAKTRTELLCELIKIDLEYRWRRLWSGSLRSQAFDAGTGRASGAQTGKTSGTLQSGKTGGVQASHGSELSSDAIAPLIDDYIRQFPEIGPLEKISLEMVGEEYRVRHKWGDRATFDSYLERFPDRGDSLKAVLERIATESLDETGRSSKTNFEELLREAPGEAAAPAVPQAANPDADEPPEDLSEATAESDQPPKGKRPAAAARLPAKLGRYQIRRPLGRGSFGAVYLGYDDQLDRQVAVKVPHAAKVKATSIEAFLREARLAAQVRHSALVEVFDVGYDEEHGIFIVMEYIAGKPLSDVLKGEPISFLQAATWIATVAEAVHCAHKRGLVHCDLKPANILIDGEQHPHVTDFGLVVAEIDQPTKRGVVSGSPAYMSPEQVRGEAHRLDGRADLWALGVLLYEMLTGRKPFAGTGIAQVFDEIQHREPKPPRQINDAITPDLEAICLRCLSKQITQRYTTCMDLALDLRQAIESASLAPQGRSRGDFSGSARERQSASHSAQQRSFQGTALRSNLPPATSSFVGRQAERQELRERFNSADVQLLTLTGPGGMGKTRLSLQVAADLLESRPGGCWFVDLSAATTAGEVAQLVARAMDVVLPAGEAPPQAVAHVLEYRRPLLLLLDNFEQAVDAAADTVGRWKQAAPQVQFLVTSRAALNLAGEVVFELGPLASPQELDELTPDDVERFPSVNLFCERARDVRPGLKLDGPTLAAISTICRSLEGIPLAVELAAARAKIFSPQEMASRLGERFDLLRSARRDLSARQQTLWGAIQWSFELLADDERQAFLQASAFRGGFDWEAAEAVIDLSACSGAPPVVDVIQSLRDKSLLRCGETPFGTRFGMYQSIREFGQRQWEQSASPDERQALNQRLTDHFIRWAEWRNAKILGGDGAEMLSRLRLEIENLLAVQDVCLERGDAEGAARAILSIARTMAEREPAQQRVVRLERSLAAIRDAASPLATRLATALSEACHSAGEWDRAAMLANQAVAAARQANQPELLAAAVLQQGEMQSHRGEPDVALQAFIEAEELCRQQASMNQLASCLVAHGFLVWQLGDSAQGQKLLTEAEQLVRARGNRLDSVRIARHRGQILAQQGDLFQALRCFAEAETTARELGDDRAVRLAIGDQATTLARQGDFAGALDCYKKAESLARRLGDKKGIANNVGNRGVLLADQGQPQAALECYEQAEALNRAMQSKMGIAVNIGNRAAALGDLDRYDEALKLFAEAEALNQAMKNKYLLAINRGDRAALHYQHGDHAAALDDCRSSLELLEAANSLHSNEGFIVQSQLALILEKQGDDAGAKAAATHALSLAAERQLTETFANVKVREHLAAMRRLTDGV